MMPTTMEFSIGDTVIYRNPMTNTFDKITVTSVCSTHARFNGIQVGGPIQDMFGVPALVLGCRANRVADVLKGGVK